MQIKAKGGRTSTFYQKINVLKLTEIDENLLNPVEFSKDLDLYNYIYKISFSSVHFATLFQGIASFIIKRLNVKIRHGLKDESSNSKFNSA